MLNCAVSWNSINKTVYVFRNGKCLTLQLGSSVVNEYEFEVGSELCFTTLAKESKIYSDDDRVTTIAIDGRTLVPMRAISELLGAKVDWDGDTQTASITWVTPEDSAYVLTIADKKAQRMTQEYNLIPSVKLKEGSAKIKININEEVKDTSVLVGKEVSLEGTDVKAITAEDGSCTIAEVTAGTYNIIVEVPEGYYLQNETNTITVVGGTEVTVTVDIKKTVTPAQ